MDSSPDQTMRNLLAVHRYEVSELEDKLKLADGNLTNLRYVSDRQVEDIKRLKSEIERHRATIKERDERIEKVQGVIESTALDLGNEREAHAGLRDAAREQVTHLRAAITELAHHGDLTPSGKRVLEQIIGGE